MMPFLRDRFASLTADLLVFVADALALVGLRLPERPHLGCKLPDELLVDPLDRDMRLVGTGDREACRNLDLQLVGEPNAKLQHVLLDRGEVADAHDLELLLKALRYAFHHIGGERSRQAVHRAGDPGVAVAKHLDNASGGIDLDRDRRMDAVLELAEWTFHRKRTARDGRLHTLGNRNGSLTNTRHRLPDLSDYQSSQRTSPPSFFCRASRSLTTPLDVERIEIPSPPSTGRSRADRL